MSLNKLQTKFYNNWVTDWQLPTINLPKLFLCLNVFAPSTILPFLSGMITIQQITRQSTTVLIFLTCDVKEQSSAEVSIRNVSEFIHPITTTKSVTWLFLLTFFRGLYFNFEWVSDYCLTPMQQFFLLYHVENKLIFNEMMMRSALVLNQHA